MNNSQKGVEDAYNKLWLTNHEKEQQLPRAIQITHIIM